ncbi:hypothetical protein EZS27_041019, partial [termite gut metagenome]
MVVGLLDFQKLEELSYKGYDSTIAMMDSIKKRIPRRVDADSLSARRKAYRNKFPELCFKNIYIQGANQYQQEYIKKEFRKNTDDVFSYENLKQG